MSQEFAANPNYAQTPAYIPDIEQLFDHLLVDVPAWGRLLVDHDGVLSHKIAVTDREMLLAAGYAPDVAEIYLYVEDEPVQPDMPEEPDALRQRFAFVIYQYDAREADHEPKHSLLFELSNDVGIAGLERTMTGIRKYKNLNQVANPLIDPSEIQVGEVSCLNKLLALVEAKVLSDLKTA